MLRPPVAAAFAAALTAAAVAGCHSTSSGHASAKVSALATSTTAAQGKADLKTLTAKCIPPGSLAQVTLLNQLAADTKKHPNGSRHRLFTCLGVPQQNQQRAESQALAAAGKVNWRSTDARHQYFEVTLVQIVQANQAGH